MTTWRESRLLLGMRLQSCSLSRTLGVLSIASGAAMLAAPLTMARVYAMPRHEAVLRVLGARDVIIGCCMVGRQRRLGAVLRMVSDVADGALIYATARKRSRPLREVSLHLVVAATSALLAARAQR